MSSNEALYIGLMSGTSLDSIDAALVTIDQDHCRLLEHIEHEIPPLLRQQLIDLCQPGDNEIDRMAIADRELGEEFSKAVAKLLIKSEYSAKDILAIGSHGQTIRHRPCSPTKTVGFTLQIGDPNTIALNTQIVTVADFRRRDIAAGGQGAPLAPAFHRAQFSSRVHNRAIINIGGIANITYLGRSGEYLGYDTGPGNGLMDAWINHRRHQKFDCDGEWADSGKLIPELLQTLLNHPYFSKAVPKSTGREDFNIDWLLGTLSDPRFSDSTFADEDVQATLLELTARSISTELKKHPVAEIYICGGGAYNKALMARLQALAEHLAVENTEVLGVAAQWVEAAAFAWLAKQTLDGKSAKLMPVTGASCDVILGAIFPV